MWLKAADYSIHQRCKHNSCGRVLYECSNKLSLSGDCERASACGNEDFSTRLVLSYSMTSVVSCEIEGRLGFGRRNGSCCCLSAGWVVLHPVFSLGDTKTQQRGEERLPTAKLFSQQVTGTCFLFSVCKSNTIYILQCSQVDTCGEHRVLLLDSRHHSVQVLYYSSWSDAEKATTLFKKKKW